MRVSDDDYWKDFPGDRRSPTPRLLQSDVQLYRPFGDWSTYARVQRWQVLQTVDPTTRIDPPPYERLPQVGTRYAAPWLGGVEVGFEGEFNRFANPDDHYLGSRLTGDRVPRARQHQPAVLHARLDLRAQGLVQRRLVLGRPAPARRPAQRLAGDPDPQRRQRLGPGARHPALRQDLPRDARAAPLLRQHAVPSARTTCRTSTPSPRTSTSTRSSPRTPSRASTGCPTAHQLTAGLTSRLRRSADRRRGAAPGHRAALPVQRPEGHARRRSR